MACASEASEGEGEGRPRSSTHPTHSSESDRRGAYLGQGVSVGNAVEGDGRAGRADGGVDIDDLGGVDDGVVTPSGDGGCGSENGGD